MVAALSLIHFGDMDRKIYLYDTFAGMTEPTDEDVRHSTQTREALPKWNELQKEDHNDWCFVPLNEVKQNMLSTAYPETNIIFIKGAVEDTIPQTIPSQIALLRLDTDWYSSTKHELQYLFPKLTTSGLLIVDDYGHWAGAKKAVDEYFTAHPVFLARVDETGRVGIKM